VPEALSAKLGAMRSDAGKKLRAKLLRRPSLLGVVMMATHPGFRIRYSRHFTVRRRDRVVLLDRRHAAYLPFLIDNFELLTNAVRPTREGSQSIWDFRGDEPAILADGTPWRFAGLPETHATGEHYVDMLGVQSGDVVWDIGAYSGLSSRAFAQAIGPDGTVFAIEADPGCFSCATSNLADRPAVEVQHAALWDESGTVQFQAEGNQGSAVADAGPRSDQLVDVPSITPVELLERSGGRVDAVKLDIEGAEYRVLPAFAQVLELGQRPRFLIEAHNARSGRVETEQLMDFLRGYGYQAEVVSQPERGPFPLIVGRPRRP
jgi:FkbM family methyltransferase